MDLSFFASTLCERGGFLSFPHWWAYLPDSAFDNSTSCSVTTVSIPGDLLAIGLAVLDMLIFVAGFVAVVMIIVAGINYMLAIGNSEKVTSARRSIINSIVGLAIVMDAAAFVSFIGTILRNG